MDDSRAGTYWVNNIANHKSASRTHAAHLTVVVPANRTRGACSDMIRAREHTTGIPGAAERSDGWP